jgi:Rieske Fe-S protein
MIAFAVPIAYVPHGLYWDTVDPYHYIRVQAGDADREIPLVGGEDHRVGQGDPETHFPRLEAWVRARFPKAGEIVSTWSGQIQEPHDGMAYIGHLPGHANVYVVTGDSGNGLTHGAVAGILLPKLIQNRKHPWSRVYAPSRTRLHALGKLATEAAKSNAPYADWLRGGEVETIDEIPPGHGARIRKGVHLLAVYKDDQGQCHVSNAKCTHLGGAVHWNQVEKSWDCPAHGSRFDCKGRVINGPAISDLGEPPANIEAPTGIPEPVVTDQPFPARG